jgi:glycerol-3-phosphate dehydrogenase
VSALSELKPGYDVVVIGGGVHGAAAAMEAARSGREVLLVEQGDFCSGTSANSLKIIHGGLRYLQSLDLRRSRESAREQSELLRRAPHLVAPLPCLMGTQRSLPRGRLAMALGLWVYDKVIRFGLPGHPRGGLLTPEQAGRLVGLDLFAACTGAALWYDAQVLDTERLVLTYLKTAERSGARILNYVSAADVRIGVEVSVGLRDVFNGESARVIAGVVIDTASLVEPHPFLARAVNLVLKRPRLGCAVGRRLQGDGVDSKRLFFATPHGDATIVGTWYFADRTQSPFKLGTAELRACMDDVRALLPDSGISENDVTGVHVGRLPVRSGDDPLSLIEQPIIRAAGDARVLSVTGVKYTTARPTAKQALRLAGLAGGDPATGGESEPWYGAAKAPAAVARQVAELIEARLDEAAGGRIIERLCRQYGSVALDIAESAVHSSQGLDRIPGCDAIEAEIEYCIDHEHCRTVSDFIRRRSGLGSLAPAPPEAARYCAEVMARRLGWSADKVAEELDNLAAHYHHVAPGL